MKVVRVVHDLPVGPSVSCYGPFTNEEAWTFADKVDEVLFKKGHSQRIAEIMDVNVPREFLNPETGEPLEL